MQNAKEISTANRTALILLAASVAIMVVILAWHNTLRPLTGLPVRTGAQVQLTPGEPVGFLYQRMVRVADPDTPCPSTDVKALLGAETLPFDGWACLKMVNPTDRPGVWRIDMNNISSGYVMFFVVRGAAEQQVLTHLPETAFSDRETGTRRLASVPVPVAAGEAIEIWAIFPNGGNIQAVEPTFRPELDFDDEMASEAHIYGGLLGTSALLLVFFTSFAALLQSRPARIYAIYFGLVLLMMAGQAGYLASALSLRPGVWIGTFQVLIGVVIAFVHFRFVSAFVFEALPHHPLALVGRRLQRYGLMLVGIAVLILLCVFAVLILTYLGWLRWLDLDAATQAMARTTIAFGFGTSGGFALLAALHAIWAARVLVGAGTQGASLFALGAVMLLCGPVIIALGPFLPPYFDVPIAFSFTLFADALVFAAAIVKQTFGLRSQRNDAIAAELAASQEQLRLSQTLLTAHQDLDQARRLAETHRTRLAHTSHDLRQPLMSLQLALKEADAAAPALRERLSSGLDYLREVLSESMADGRPDALVGSAAPDETTEPVPLSLLMSNAVRMFGEEARAKGLSLRAVDSGLSVHADPVALIRMLSNLVSNAVKYTDTGAVLIGARRRNGAIAIEVRDSGPGMTAQEVTSIRESYRRGSQAHTAEGEGIGLSSVDTLAREWGLSLTIRSAPGRGTCMAIEGLTEVEEESAPAEAQPLRA